MIDIKVGEHTVKIYRAADELPIKRYAKFQKYNLIESGVGADMDAIANHFGKLFEFINFAMKEEAVREAKNLYYTFFMMLEEITVPGMAFACLVYSIDGKEITDTGEDNLKAVVDQLSEIGLSQKIVLEQVEGIKKKILTELKLHCPKWFNDDETFQFYQRIKAKIAILARLVADENSEEAKLQLQQIEKYFAEYSAPQDFDSDSPENAALKMDSNFEQLCTILESNGVAHAENLTTLQFYSRLEYFKKINSPTKAAK
jgi:hypothetical protein